MLQNMSIAYLRGYEGKPKPKYIKGSLVEQKYNEGKSDRENDLPNMYIKSYLEFQKRNLNSKNNKLNK